MYTYKYSLTEIDNMIPWEKEVYAILLKQEKDKEKQKELDGN